MINGQAPRLSLRTDGRHYLAGGLVLATLLSALAGASASSPPTEDWNAPRANVAANGPGGDLRATLAPRPLLLVSDAHRAPLQGLRSPGAGSIVVTNRYRLLVPSERQARKYVLPGSKLIVPGGTNAIVLALPAQPAPGVYTARPYSALVYVPPPVDPGILVPAPPSEMFHEPVIKPPLHLEPKR